MKGNYNRQEETLCHRSDKHLFIRITKGESKAEIMVLKVKVGDLICLPAKRIIKRWKIISDSNGDLYLGFCKDYHSQLTGGLLFPYLGMRPKLRPRLIYFVDKSKNGGTTPILRRIHCRKKSDELIESKQATPIVLN